MDIGIKIKTVEVETMSPPKPLRKIKRTVREEPLKFPEKVPVRRK